MIECDKCGASVRYRRQPHVCRHGRAEVGMGRVEVCVGDPEFDAAKVANDTEAVNAVSEAVELVEAGWTVELAVALAIRRVQKASEEFGFFRGMRIGRAYGYAAGLTARERQNDDDGNEHATGSREGVDGGSGD